MDRAKQHVHELEASIKEFFATNPYVVAFEIDPDDGREVYKLTHVAETPPALALIAGDTVHNLRSALDLLFCQLVLANRKTINKADMFQIADTAQVFKAGGLPKIKGRVSKEAVELISRLKPYKGGNDALWRLHKMDIADKHRVLYVVGSSYTSFRPGWPRMPSLHGGEPISIAETFPNLFLRTANRMFPLKEGDVLLTQPDLSEAHDDPQFRFQIAFSETGVVEGEPIIETLHDLIRATEETIELFAPLLDG